MFRLVHKITDLLRLDIEEDEKYQQLSVEERERIEQNSQKSSRFPNLWYRVREIVWAIILIQFVFAIYWTDFMDIRAIAGAVACAIIFGFELWRDFSRGK